MSKTYRLERVEAGHKWDAFIRKSGDGTIFSYSAYLKALHSRFGIYFVYKKQELRAAAAVMEMMTEPPQFFMTL